MKVFVTGGAGFLGINLARYLLARGDQVVSYDLAPFDYPERDRVTEVHGDIRDPASLKRAMDGADAAVHAAAALPRYKPRDIYTTDIDGTRNVLQAALGLGLDRVVAISSTAVYGIPDHHPLLEDDPMEGVGPYGEAKVEAERICHQFRAKGLCVPIIRPKTFVGPERLGVFAMLYDWARSGKNFPVLGNGRNRYQFLDVEDLCVAIYLALTKPREVANDTFNVGAAEFTTLRQDYQAVLDEAGFGRRVIPIPSGPAILVLRLLEKVNLSPLYRWVYETVDKDSYVSIDRARRVLGWEPRHSNRDALVRNFRWYMANHEQFAGKSGVSHRAPWSQGVLGLAKALF